MIKIAETYIHLDLDRDDDFLSSFLEAARAYLYHRGKEFAREAFHDPFARELIVTARTQDGSFKAWVTAATAALYFGISNYGNFRTGIDYIVTDARKFSEYIISDFRGETHVPDDKVIRLERRLGVPGQIKRLFKRIDQLNISVSQTITLRNGRTEIRQNVGIGESDLQAIKDKVFQILEQFQHPEDKDHFFKSLPSQIRDEFPRDFDPAQFRSRREYVVRREEQFPESVPEVRHLPRLD